MSISISKKLRFEAAHRLVDGYEGKCASVHGHSWQVEVELTLRPEIHLNRFGFVADFSVFKKLRSWVDENLDHATLVHQNDQKMIAFLKEEHQKMYTFRCNPTSETLVLMLYDLSREMYENEHTYVSRVEVDETCTSRAMIRVNPYALSRF